MRALGVLLSLLVGGAALGAAPVPDELDAGFDTGFGVEEDLLLNLAPAEAPAPQTDALAPLRWTLQHDLAYRTSADRLVNNRVSLRLETEALWGEHGLVRFDGKLAWNAIYDEAVYPDREYPQSLRDAYRTQRLWRDGYVQGSWPAFSVKLGQQVVVWGKADAAVVTDVLSPRDQTLGFNTPIDETRIGQRMLVLEAYPGANQTVTLVFNPDLQVNQTAPAGHEFAFPFVLPEGVSLLPEKRPELGSFGETGVRWSRTSGALDLSFMGAQLLDNDPVYACAQSGSWLGEPTCLALQPEYRPVTLAGAGFNWSNGAFLWKGEGALWKNRAWTTTDYEHHPDGVALHDRVVLAGGWDYSGAGTTQVTVEVSGERVLGWEPSLLEVPEEQVLALLRASQALRQETLLPELSLAYRPAEGEWLVQARLTYDWSDTLQVSCSGTSVLARQEDTAFGRLKAYQQVAAQWVAVF